MASTESVRDFSDLYTSLMNRVREDTGDSVVTVIAKRSINEGLVDFHMGHDYKMPWAERQARLYTKARYTTGTVAVSAGGTTVTGTSTAWQDTDVLSRNNVVAGGKIRIAGSNEIYIVSSVASGTSLELADPFIGDAVTAADYLYWEDAYTLSSDYLRPVDWRNFSDEMNIEILPRDRFRPWTRNNRTTGTPKFAMLFDDDFSGNTTRVQKVAFSPPPFKIVQLPYTYITSNLAVSASGTLSDQLSNDDDEPIVPHRYRQGIVLNGLYQWYRDRRDDTRSIEAFGAYQAWLERALSDNDVGANRPRARPDMRMYRRRAARPWSGAGRFDIGGRFDRLEDINR